MVRRNSIVYALVIVLFSCSGQKPDPQVLIDTDLSFSEMSEQEGATAAFLEYADSGVVLFRNGVTPIQGYSALAEFYSSIPPNEAKLTWRPENAEIAASGDLGYTWGNYYLESSDSLGNMNKQQGNYVSIWKKQADGRWKFVLDGGTVPQPVSSNQ